MEIIRLGSEVKPGDFMYYVADYTALIYKNADGNCKHCYFDSIGSTASILNRGIKENVDPILALFKNIFDVNSKVTFSINVTSKDYVKAFQKYFTLISCVAIPTGYGNNSKQYHAIFFTNSQSRDSVGTYRTRLLREGIAISTVNQEVTLVGEAPPNKLSDADIEKILAYKSKYYLKKFLLSKFN